MNGRKNVRHGYAKHSATERRKPEFRSWTEMKQRCHNERSKDFCRYGGRGISVCEEWRESFDAFLAYMGDRPGPGYSIDRIDVNGNYEPGNVRWATVVEQNKNTTRSKMVTIGGVTRNQCDWVAMSGVSRNTFAQRLKNGCPEHLLLVKGQVFRPPQRKK